MVEELGRARFLDQDHAASQIEAQFGSDYVNINEAGNLAISKAALTAFRKMTTDDVVWSRRDRQWRYREPGDEPGRMQV
jgi:hypothetical protein